MANRNETRKKQEANDNFYGTEDWSSFRSDRTSMTKEPAGSPGERDRPVRAQKLP